MNKWYCLTIVWKTGEVQSVWTTSYEIARRFRLKLREDSDIKTIKLYRNNSPK